MNRSQLNSPLATRVIGLLASPVCSSIVVFIVVFVEFIGRDMLFSQFEISSFISSLYCVATFVLGSPSYIALLHCGRSNAIEYAAAGFVIGIAATVSTILLFSIGETFLADINESDIVWIIISLFSVGLLGSLNAGTFWLVVRPDKRTPKVASL
jgi:hypothetical protein